MIIADRMEKVAICSFFSKAEISFRMTNEQYLTFKTQVIPCFIGWVWDAVFGGRKIQDFSPADDL